MCWLCAVPLCTPIFPHKPRGGGTVVWKRAVGGGAEPCGRVSECHTEQKKWNNGSNVGGPPLLCLPTLTLCSPLPIPSSILC